MVLVCIYLYTYMHTYVCISALYKVTKKCWKEIFRTMMLRRKLRHVEICICYCIIFELLNFYSTWNRFSSLIIWIKNIVLILLSFLFSSLSLLPIPFKAPLCFSFYGVVLSIESRALYTLGKCSAIELHHQPKDTVLYTRI